MSHIWTFSTESQLLLKLCFAAAKPTDESNKWLQRFGPRNLNLLQKYENTVVITDSPETEDSHTNQENQEEDITKSIEEFLDPELDIIAKFDYFVDRTRKNQILLTKLAQTLPVNITERLFEHIFCTDNLSSDFLEYFFTYFVIYFMKHDKTRICSDILLKTYHKYPQYFKILLKLILKDVEMENNILNDFILNLNPTEQSDFINIMADIDLTTEEFSYNLFNICTAYKSCTKTEKIQDAIFLILKNYSSFCCNDKNYGKILLAFLQQEKSLKRDVIIKNIGEVIEEHKTPFKRACLSILKEIKEGD